MVGMDIGNFQTSSFSWLDKKTQNCGTDKANMSKKRKGTFMKRDLFPGYLFLDNISNQK